MKHVPAVAALALLLLFGQELHAQSRGSSRELPVFTEYVEVVATQLPEVPHDVPASIEVLSGDDLRNSGAVTLQDALSLASGVVVAPGGDSGPAGSVPEFWGLREFDAFLLVVDGVPWGGAFNPALTTLSLHDVDRIEILRGSAPVTYGATSFVGVIHVVHRSGAASKNEFSLRGGSFGSGAAAIDMNVPMASWKSRLTADLERRGFQDDRTSYSRGHTLWRSERSVNGVRTAFGADLNLLRQSPASPSPRQGSSISMVPLDANYNPANAFANENRMAFSFDHSRPLKETQWSTSASYTFSGQRQFRGFLTSLQSPTANAAGFRENIDINDLYVDSHLTFPARRGIQFSFGSNFLFANGEGRGAVFNYSTPLSGAAATAVPEPTNLNLDSESRRQFFGAYLLSEWKPAERVTLSSGLRLNVTNERRGEGAGTTNTRPSGSVGGIFSAWENGANHVRFFVDYRNTFKPAAFDFSLAENEGVLAPETAQSYETGIKTRSYRGRLDLEASVFRMDFNNLVTATSVDGIPALINSGKTRFRGLDTAADIRLLHEVSARMSYSYHDGKFVDFVQDYDGIPTQLSGNRFEMSARHLASAGIVVAPAEGVTADIVVRYNGDRYLDKRNRALAPAFTTMDAGIGYRWSRWEFRIDGRNLSDRRDAVSESELGESQYYRMTGRRLDAGFSLRF